MKIDLWSVVILAFLPLALRTILYLLAFRFRSIKITISGCMVIAGSGYLVGFILAALQLHVPEFLRYAASIGAAMFLMTRYTEAEIFPDVLSIPLVVEVLSSTLTDSVFVPMLR